MADTDESTSQCFITADRHGVVRSANRAACEAFGYYGGMTGLPLSALMPPPFDTHHANFLERRLSRPFARSRAAIVVPAKHSSGSVFRISLSIDTVEVPGSDLLFTALIDVLPVLQMGLVLDATGVTKAVTNTFTEHFGWTDDDLLDRPLSYIVPAIRPIFSHFASPSPFRQRLEQRIRNQSGWNADACYEGTHIVTVRKKRATQKLSEKNTDDAQYLLCLSQPNPREILVDLETLHNELLLLACEFGPKEVEDQVPGFRPLCITAASPASSWILGLPASECVGKDFIPLILNRDAARELERHIESLGFWYGSSMLGQFGGSSSIGMSGRMWRLEAISLPDGQVSIRVVAQEHQGDLFAGAFATFQQYKVEHLMGEGTYGAVYRAVHLLTQSPVAIKILPRADSPTRIPREVQLQGQLVHENIAMLYDLIVTTDYVAIVQELLTCDLHTAMQDHAIPEETARGYVFDLANGVKYLHASGIAHRDLKLENLMIGSGGRIKIIDLGLAARFRPGETLNTACGTPSYIAPEMVERRPYLPEQVDYWSMGVCIYAMVTCYYPFADFPDVLAVCYDWPENVGSREIKDLVAGLLQLDPSKRLTPREVLSHAWMRAASSQFNLPRSYSCVVPDFSVQGGRLTLRNDILARMHADFGFEPSLVVRSLQSRLLNPVSMTYKLLLRRYQDTRMVTSNRTMENLFLQISNSVWSYDESHVEDTTNTVAAVTDSTPLNYNPVDSKSFQSSSPGPVRVDFSSNLILRKALRSAFPDANLAFALHADFTIEEVAGMESLQEALGWADSDMVGVSFLNLLSVQDRAAIEFVESFFEAQVAAASEFRAEMVHWNGSVRIAHLLIQRIALLPQQDELSLTVSVTFRSETRKVSACETPDAELDFSVLREQSRCYFREASVSLSRLRSGGTKEPQEGLSDFQSKLDRLTNLTASALTWLTSQPPIRSQSTVQTSNMVSVADVLQILDSRIPTEILLNDVHLALSGAVYVANALKAVVAAAASFGGPLKVRVRPTRENFIAFEVMDSAPIPTAERSLQQYPAAVCLWKAAQNIVSQISAISVLTLEDLDGEPVPGARWIFSALVMES